METWQWAAVLFPLIIVELTLMIVSLVDLAKREKVRGGSRLVWALVIIFFNLIGPVVYLLWGRESGIERYPD